MSERETDTRPETATYLRYLEETDTLREQTTREMIAALDLPAGSRGLDVGCGVGTQALMLAEAVGAEGRVTGVDVAPELVERAREVTSAKGMSGRVAFEVGDYRSRLPFGDDAFDWVWSSDCLGALSVPREVIRVLKPGGGAHFSFWSSEQLLPGYPVLESRLEATRGGLAPFVADGSPETHPLRALGRLRQAGLTPGEVLTFAVSVFAPLDAETRRGMTDILEMRWPGVESELSAEEFALYRRLTDPASPDFILNLADYYGFFTYSLFSARLPASAA